MESGAGRDAGRSLHLAEEARAAVAGRVVSPRWYHLAIGVLVAQHVLVQVADDTSLTLPSGVLLVAGCAMLWLWWRRRIGVTVGAWTGRRSLFLLGLRSLLALVCIWTAAWSAAPAVAAAAAVVAVLGGVQLGRRYDAALRHDLLHHDLLRHDPLRHDPPRHDPPRHDPPRPAPSAAR